MSLNQHQGGSGNSNIPVSEVYWALVAKADKKFSKIRDLPYYQRTRYDTYFYKVFKVYTQLWKFQQENRQKLVEAGLKRWEIGEIASRIGQLYFGQYMRTSEASYLSESYVFYEAILTREYFKDGLHQDINLASKQLRFIARFLTVCLVLNRREVVYQLVNQLKMLLDECKRTFQGRTQKALEGVRQMASDIMTEDFGFAKAYMYTYGNTYLWMDRIIFDRLQAVDTILYLMVNKETDFKEWKLVIQEIVKFLKIDAAFMNNRPLRYSVVLDLQPDSLPIVLESKKSLKLRDALLCSYHPNEVKFSELTVDTFRMLQCLEWEPGGSFYQPSRATSTGSGSGSGQNGAPGTSHVNKDITDPTLPPNPRKAILYRPSVTHFIAVSSASSRLNGEISSNVTRSNTYTLCHITLKVLGTICEELPTDGILLIYLSTSESSTYSVSSPIHAGSTGYSENILRGLQFHSTNFEPTSSRHLSTGLDNADHTGRGADCLHIGPRGLGGMNCIYPSDILPFTRRPLFLVIDSENSKAFKDMSSSEKGEPVAMLLSPAISLPLPAVELSCQHSGSFFTSFLTAPLQSLVLLLGLDGSDIEKDLYSKAEKLLQSSSNEWGSLLAASDNLDPVWSQILSDPFLRRLLLRFVFCRAVLFLDSQSSNKIEFVPECMPRLPEVVSPMSSTCQALVAQLADIFGATDRFIFPGTHLP